MKATFIKRQQETPTIYSFIFRPEQSIHFQAGQFIDITAPHKNPDQRGIKRHFSISSSPTEDFLMVTTRIIEEGSTFKQALLKLSLGTMVEIGIARGTFVLPEDKNLHCLFITGGVGIAPIRSIIKYTTDKKLQNPLTLLYSNVIPEEIAFYDFFEGLKKQNTNLDIVYAVTKPKESKSAWSGRVGRIKKELVQGKIKDREKTQFYISGPISLVDNFYELLKEMGVLEESIKRENFPGY